MTWTEKSAEDALTVKFVKDFEFYALRCLHIRTKEGTILPLKFNRSQQALHEKIEDQVRRTGRVRMLVLKSRQVGISTYFCARSYHKSTFRKGFHTFVLTQEDDTTTALFNMVKRFHEQTPDFVRPVTGASNAKELKFSRLDSGYLVSTAGNRSTGRGHTIQVFHGSEVSRWPNAEEHVAGVMQSVPDVPGSEVYLESTANGINNLFHTKWRDAVEGKGQFEAIFIPWFWHEEYTKEAPEGWKPPVEFVEYGNAHELTLNQVYWAYEKNVELAQASRSRPDELCWLFRQEYPATADEAFQTAGTNSFIRGELVQKARKSQTGGFGPIVLGVDVARGGEDKSAIIDRQGRRMGGHVLEKFDFGKDSRPLVGKIVSIVRDLRSDNRPLKKIFVDATGVGGPVYDMLRSQLGDELVEGIEFGGRALNTQRYANRRAEMWDKMLAWFMNPAGVAISDVEGLQSDLCAPAWGKPDVKTGQSFMTRYRLDGTLLLEDKDHMKRRLKFSPDWGDAAALTFASSFDEYTETAVTMPVHVGQGAWML